MTLSSHHLLRLAVVISAIPSMESVELCTADEYKTRDAFLDASTQCAQFLFDGLQKQLNFDNDLICSDACHDIVQGAINGSYPNCKSTLPEDWDGKTQFFFDWIEKDKFAPLTLMWNPSDTTYEVVEWAMPKDTCDGYTPAPVPPKCSADDITAMTQYADAVQSCASEFENIIQGDTTVTAHSCGNEDRFCSDSCANIKEASLNGSYPFCDASDAKELKTSFIFDWGSYDGACFAMKKEIQNKAPLKTQIRFRQSKDVCEASTTTSTTKPTTTSDATSLVASKTMLILMLIISTMGTTLT